MQVLDFDFLFLSIQGHVNATQQSTIWARICRNKKPVIEPKQSAQFAQAINVISYIYPVHDACCFY